MNTHLLIDKAEIRTFWSKQLRLEGALIGFLMYNTVMIGSLLLNTFLPVEGGGLNGISDVMVAIGVMLTFGILAGFALMPFTALVGNILGFFYGWLLSHLGNNNAHVLMNRKVYTYFATVLLMSVIIIVFVIGVWGYNYGLAYKSDIALSIRYMMVSGTPVLLLIAWRLLTVHQQFMMWYFDSDSRKRKQHEPEFA